jgi:hypothetical protein
MDGMRKSYLAGLAITIGATIVVPAAPARAADTGVQSAVCTLYAAATGFTPMPALGSGGGSFSFSGPVSSPDLCLVTDGLAAPDTQTGIYTGVISTTGSYSSVTCGTGTASGSGTLSVSPVSRIDFSYQMPFSRIRESSSTGTMSAQGTLTSLRTGASRSALGQGAANIDWHVLFSTGVACVTAPAEDFGFDPIVLSFESR